ncbi:MAG TPA: DNRLRE domain-containing protein [Candidatus Thermoplasmatota archaeon]|nr:DNRLRE domain-containing protein [Candidatus Thermoplasmatota archaeon]
MAIVHDISVNYNSTIDVLAPLLYDFSYDNTLTSKPLYVIMHGWSLDKSTIVAEIKERVINNYSCAVLVPDMRGRPGGGGNPDANGREIYDIYDAVQDVLSVYSARIDSTNINIVGYSGGYHNALMACEKFPDFFGVVGMFAGMSDYGYNDPDGWWYTNTGNRALLTNWIEGIVPYPPGDPITYPNRFYCRGGVFFLRNTKYSRCRMYHDTADILTPIINTTKVQAQISSLSYTNWDIDISEPADAQRWPHGLPIIGDPGEPTIQAEPIIFADINSGNYKNPSIDNAGTLSIPVFLKTKNFEIWLSSGDDPDVSRDAGEVTYNLNKKTYTIRNNNTTLNSAMNVILKHYGLSASKIYRVTVDSVTTYINTNASGVLIYDTGIYGTKLNANEEITIAISGVDIMAPTVTVIGDYVGMVGNNKDNFLRFLTPDNTYGGEKELFLRTVAAGWDYGIGRFDLSMIPTNAVIVSAIATFTRSNTTVPAGEFSISGHLCLTDWGVTKTDAGINDAANSASWNETKIAPTNSKWAGGGAVTASDYGSAGPITTGNMVDAAGTKYLFDFTEMARQWVLGDATNLGWFLIRSDAINNLVRLSSQESLVPAWRPFLTVTWSLPSTGITRQSHTAIHNGIAIM